MGKPALLPPGDGRVDHTLTPCLLRGPSRHGKPPWSNLEFCKSAAQQQSNICCPWENCPAFLRKYKTSWMNLTHSCSLTAWPHATGARKQGTNLMALSGPQPSHLLKAFPLLAGVKSGLASHLTGKTHSCRLLSLSRKLAIPSPRVPVSQFLTRPIPPTRAQNPVRADLLLLLALQASLFAREAFLVL